MTEQKYPPLEPDAEFYNRVYAEVAKIPSGKVCTYGTVAQLAGYPNAAREVGLAMSRVPQGADLPCHRVVTRVGTLAPGYAFGSQAQQRALLEAEGIAFRTDGTINMEKIKWPDGPGGKQLSFF